MAAVLASDLVARAREVRNQDQLQVDEAVLREIQDFLLCKEAKEARSATHVLLENFPDWWVRNRRAPSGLEIERQEDLEELYRHAGTLFALGIPLTLAERRSTAFRFFQDIEVWGTREASMPSSELIGPDTQLTRLLGALVAEVFPGHPGFLDAALYDATGLSQTKGVRKTSLRLVWPGVVVDTDRAARVRDLLVHRLSTAAAAGGPIADLEVKMKGFSQQNAWHSMFGDAAYGTRAMVRMPLSDRVAPLPLRAPERRPLAPVGVLRFSFGGEGKMKVEWLCQQGDLDDGEWVKIGCLRQGPDAQLTEWCVPSWSGNQPVAPSSTSKRVKVRTAGGSDGGGGLRLQKATPNRSAPERAGATTTIERRVSGPVDQFCDKMDQHLGKAIVEPDGSVVWKQPEGTARIVLYTADKRVKVVGRTNEVRSLAVFIAPYTEAAPGLGQQEMNSPWLQQPEGRNPGDVHAPQGGALPEDGQLRQAHADFGAEGEGELSLQRGDVVRIVEDPQGDDDRWVYGRLEATGACGWFPWSHTSPLDETTQPQVS